jgi:hypothetical protein
MRDKMIYIKCSKCSNVHNTFLSDSFSTCGCGGRMKLIRIADEQHQKAVSALQEYLDALVTSSLERVQELIKAKGLSFCSTYEDWAENWLLKNSDARSYEGIEYVCSTMLAMRDGNEEDEIFEAADWAVLTADAAERAVSWFEEGKIYDMLWWLDGAVYDAEAVKGLSSYRTLENYRTRKAEVLALLKENGYDVVI